jgi:uncharacterized glyoxalase superfamily protein PhnB
VVDDAARAIEFYTRAFGARELFRMPGPDGRIMHGEFTIGDSPIMIADSNAETGAVSARTLKGSPVSIFLYVDGVDELFARRGSGGDGSAAGH